MMRTTPFMGPLGVLIVTPFAPPGDDGAEGVGSRVGLVILQGAEGLEDRGRVDRAVIVPGERRRLSAALCLQLQGNAKEIGRAEIGAPPAGTYCGVPGAPLAGV